MGGGGSGVGRYTFKLSQLLTKLELMLKLRLRLAKDEWILMDSKFVELILRKKICKWLYYTDEIWVRPPLYINSANPSTLFLIFTPITIAKPLLFLRGPINLTAIKQFTQISLKWYTVRTNCDIAQSWSNMLKFSIVHLFVFIYRVFHNELYKSIVE